MMIDYDMIPEHCRGGLRRYVEHGVPPGSFLTAVLENNLVMAFGKADHINRLHLHEYTTWLYNEAPAQPMRSWGSPAIVDAWIKAGGLSGILRGQAKQETSA